MDLQIDSGISSVWTCSEVPDTTFTALEYPGYVRNIEAALRTLGGTEGLRASLGPTATNNFVKLHLRPADPLSHPLFGDKHLCRDKLLLRISRRRPGAGLSMDVDAAAAGAGLGSSSSDPAGVQVQVMGRVDTIVRFSGLSDFQYLSLAAVPPTLRGGPAMNAPEAAEPQKLQQPLMLVPPLFSRTDTPADYAFKQHITEQGESRFPLN